jgi:hypothetical protein
MSDLLTVARFLTRCRSSRLSGLNAAMVDRIARGPFLQACSRELEGLRDPELCRIRRLDVRLTIGRGDISEARLASLWAAAFARSLRQALTRPDARSTEIVRSRSRADWLARWIADLIAGTARSRWEYDEFRPLDGLAPARAAVTQLIAEPGTIGEVLDALDARDRLEHFLGLLDEESMERLIAEASIAVGVDGATSCVGDVIAVARMLVSGAVPIVRGKIADRRLALILFVQLRRVIERPAPQTPRRVFHALSALAALLEMIAKHGGRLDELPRLSGTVDAQPPGNVHPDVAGLLAAILDLARRPAGSPATRPLADLSDALERLRPHAQSPRCEQIPWISSDLAGLFLLVEPLLQLGWPRRWLAGPFGASHGQRAVNFLLAGLALAATGQFSEKIERLNSGLALFAGFFGEPDLSALRRFFESPMPGEVSQEAPAAASSSSWASELDALAGLLLRAFASGIRGFRESSRAFIVSRLVATPGEIRVEEKRLLVRLAPNPLHVALHVSGRDYPVGPVVWYGDRMVEFELTGL